MIVLKNNNINTIFLRILEYQTQVNHFRAMIYILKYHSHGLLKI